MHIFTGRTRHVIPGCVAVSQLLHQDAGTWQAVAEDLLPLEPCTTREVVELGLVELEPAAELSSSSHTARERSIPRASWLQQSTMILMMPWTRSAPHSPRPGCST